jgi:hypothetical protein
MERVSGTGWATRNGTAQACITIAMTSPPAAPRQSKTHRCGLTLKRSVPPQVGHGPIHSRDRFFSLAPTIALYATSRISISAARRRHASKASSRAVMLRRQFGKCDA